VNAVKKFVVGSLSALAFLMTFVAQTSAASACMLLFYDPELPKALRK
jgi:cyclic lactone autoinducer peptide